MIAKLPAFSNPSARRAESSNAQVAQPSKPNQASSFELTLQQSQRDSRLREPSRGKEVSEKPVETRKEKAPVSNEKAGDSTPPEVEATDAQDLEAADVAVDDAAPAGAEGGSKTAEEGEAKVIVVAGETIEAVEEEPEETSEEELAGDEVYAATVTAVANQLSQQVATSIAAGTQVVEQPVQLAVAVVSSDAAKPKVAVPKAEGGETLPPQLDAENAAPIAAPSKDELNRTSPEQGGDEPSDFPPAEAKSTELHGEKSTLMPVASSAPAMADSNATATNAAASPAPQPNASVGETVSAQFAQLPQADAATGNEEVNIGRLTRGLSSAINQRGGSVTLRLTPPELGLVKIEMAVRDGAVSAKFTAQTESVRNLLMDQMSHLRQALDRQGLTVEKFEVQVLPQSSSASSGGFGKQSDDLSRDGRSAGQYTSSQGGEEGRGSRQPHRGRGADTFDRAMADVAR